jgi:hypothetical protein
MNKKFIIIAILAVFLTATIASSTVMAIESEIIIEADTQIDNSVLPSETEEIELTIQYKINYTTMPSLSKIYNKLIFESRIGRMLVFGKDYFYFFKSKALDIPPANLTLSLTGVPTWCTATLDKDNVSIEITDKFTEAKAKVTILVAEDAPAFETADIKIIAEFKNEDWKIGESSNDTTISVEVDYVPEITFESEQITKVIPPLNETTIPINITNLGNGKTTVRAVVINSPINFNISIDSETTIEVGKEKSLNLIVQPTDKNFGNETITIQFTPVSYDDSSLEGETYQISVTLANDGSLEEENGNGGFSLPGFGLIALIVAIGIALIVIKRRK